MIVDGLYCSTRPTLLDFLSTVHLHLTVILFYCYYLFILTCCRILLRVCNFLKSRAESIRIIARDTLVKIALALGPRFLPFIVKEMRSVLTKGYQAS